MDCDLYTLAQFGLAVLAGIVIVWIGALHLEGRK